MAWPTWVPAVIHEGSERERWRIERVACRAVKRDHRGLQPQRQRLQGPGLAVWRLQSHVGWAAAMRSFAAPAEGAITLHVYHNRGHTRLVEDLQQQNLVITAAMQAKDDEFNRRIGRRKLEKKDKGKAKRQWPGYDGPHPRTGHFLETGSARGRGAFPWEGPEAPQPLKRSGSQSFRSGSCEIQF